MKKPIQINPNKEAETLYKGLDDFLKISFIMNKITIKATIYRDPNKKYEVLSAKLKNTLDV
tara:strand:- start:3 stop:185 length:183 start_codon:yes stop_codon:yes gene_type:complete